MAPIINDVANTAPIRNSVNNHQEINSKLRNSLQLNNESIIVKRLRLFSSIMCVLSRRVALIVSGCLSVSRYGLNN